MSESYLEINFTCREEHKGDWEIVLQMLAQGQRGWKLQDAIDPISEDAANELEEVWEKLEYGEDSFEVLEANIDNISCQLKLMTGGLIIDHLKLHFVNWLASCPVSDIRSGVTLDSE